MGRHRRAAQPHYRRELITAASMKAILLRRRATRFLIEMPQNRSPL
jgi:hypothetical protein